jgi:hypothetical protein
MIDLPRPEDHNPAIGLHRRFLTYFSRRRADALIQSFGLAFLAFADRQMHSGNQAPQTISKERIHES